MVGGGGGDLYQSAADLLGALIDCEARIVRADDTIMVTFALSEALFRAYLALAYAAPEDKKKRLN